MNLPISYPIGSMYGIYANIGGILMVNVTIYSSTMDPMGIITMLLVFRMGGGLATSNFSGASRPGPFHCGQTHCGPGLSKPELDGDRW
jgi:hypothetical protein